MYGNDEKATQWVLCRLARKLELKGKRSTWKRGHPHYFHTRLINMNVVTVHLLLSQNGYFVCFILCSNQTCKYCRKQWSRAVYEIILTVSVYELGCKDNGEIGRRLWFLNPQRKQKVSLWCRSGQTRRVSCFLHHNVRGSCGKHRRRRRRWERNSFNCLLLHFFFFFVFDGVYPVGSTWAKRGTRGGVGWRKRRTIKQKWIFSSSSFANQEQ